VAQSALRFSQNVSGVRERVNRSSAYVCIEPAVQLLLASNMPIGEAERRPKGCLNDAVAS
jgi:hypothetical protein